MSDRSEFFTTATDGTLRSLVATTTRVHETGNGPATGLAAGRELLEQILATSHAERSATETWHDYHPDPTNHHPYRPSPVAASGSSARPADPACRPFPNSPAPADDHQPGLEPCAHRTTSFSTRGPETNGHSTHERTTMTARTTPRARHDIADRNRQDENREPVGQDYLTPAEFAANLCVSIRTVRNWMKTGVIHATRVGPRLIRIPTTEIQRVAVPVIEPATVTRPVTRNRR